MSRINLTSVLVTIAMFIVLLFAATASAKPNKPTSPNGGVAYFDSGWTETTYDSSGHQIGSPRTGTGSQQPYSRAAVDSAGETTNQALVQTTTTSSSGCKSVDWYESGHSAIFGSLLYRFHQVDYWCWSYPSITTFSVYTYVSNVDSAQQYRGVISSSDYFYTWSGSSRGGHYSFKQAKFDNCVLKYGCIGSSYPWTKVWINGNGAWTADDGGGA